MDAHRHKTQKRTFTDLNEKSEQEETFKNLLEDSAREAYSRPWHRLERGLRLNRLRFYVEETALQHNMSKEEKEAFFVYLQKALDKKLLNTLKVVQYDQEKQKINSIKGLELKRNTEGTLRWGFSAKKQKIELTRKKRKEDTIQNESLNQTKIDGENVE